MWPNDVFQHATDGEHADLERLLSGSRLFFGKSAFQHPNHYQTENAGYDEHHRVPRDRILWRVRAENGFRRGTKLCQKLLPERIGVLHFEVVGRLAKILIDKFY